MSGDSRDCSSTEGSIFLAAAKAAALSSTPDSALRPISKTGSDACDIESDMELDPWVVIGIARGERRRS
jgi:hypothetical protein